MTVKKFSQTWLPLLLATGLVLAVGLQWLGGRADRNYQPPPPLATLLPKAITGWQAVDRPLAASEEESAMISEVLNYDDAVFRVYQRGTELFTVYAAHWAPGRMSPRLVATHTPDVCWAGNGWERQRDAEQQPLPGGLSESEAVPPLQAKAGLLPAQFRIFQRSDKTVQHLIFWHIYGGEILNYDTQYAPPWWAMFTDLAKNGLAQRKEQWFVRIGSSVPYPALWADAGFQQVIAQLAKMCLQAPPVSSGTSGPPAR